MIAVLAVAIGCHRDPPVVPDAAAALAGPRDVARFLEAAFALRDAAHSQGRGLPSGAGSGGGADATDEQLASRPEAAWLRGNVAWDLVAVLGASHGLAEAPIEMATGAWPAALDDAERAASDARRVVHLTRMLAEDAGRGPCTYVPPTEAETAFLTGYLALGTLPSGVDPALGARLAHHRARAAEVTDFVVARCAGGLRAVAFGRLAESTTTRLVPVVLNERPRPVR